MKNLMVVRLTGGLGNQLFMWAFGRSLSLLRKEPVQYHWVRSSWDYELDKYNIKVDLTSEINKSIFNERTFAYDSAAFEQPSDRYFNGYWQSEKYILDPNGLRNELQLKKPLSSIAIQWLDRILNTNSMALHVRRGDYIHSPGTAAYHGFPGMLYYQNALALMRQKIGDGMKVFVFSDDKEWCRENFNAFEIVEDTDMHEDLELIKNCKHGILSNSSFGWWSNWLGDYSGRVVIAPQKWFNNSAIDTSDLIPERWFRI